jgi:hypothetical protein
MNHNIKEQILLFITSCDDVPDLGQIAEGVQIELDECSCLLAEMTEAGEVCVAPIFDTEDEELAYILQSRSRKKKSRLGLMLSAGEVAEKNGASHRVKFPDGTMGLVTDDELPFLPEGSKIVRTVLKRDHDTDSGWHAMRYEHAAERKNGDMDVLIDFIPSECDLVDLEQVQAELNALAVDPVLTMVTHSNHYLDYDREYERYLSQGNI